MTTSINNISDCKKELIFLIPKEEFSPVYNGILRNIQQRIKMPGFRPGKVPTHLIARQYGASLKYEAIEEIIKKSLKEFTESNKFKIVGTPALTNVKENADGSNEVIIEFEVMPEFDLKDYKSIEIYEPVHRVSDEEIEKELTFQATRLGTKKETKSVRGSNIVVTVDAYKMDPVTKIVTDDKPSENVVLDFSSTMGIDNIKKLFTNKKVGDEVEYHPDKKAANYKAEKLIIKKIEKITPCVIDDEFAKKATNDRFDNLEDFKQEIGFQLQKQWDDRAKTMMEEQLLLKIVELHNDFTLPSVFIDKAKEHIVQNFKTQNPHLNLEDEVNQEYINSTADKMIRIEMIRDKIIEKENLTIEDFDFDNFVDNYFLANPEMATTMGKDMLLSHIKNDEQMQDRLLQQKFIDFVMDFTKTNEIDFEEYAKLNSSKTKEKTLV